MSVTRIVLPFVAALIVVTPGFGGDIISCDSFENCPDGSVPLTNALLVMEARMDALEAKNTALEAKNAALEMLLAGVSRGIEANTGEDTLTFTNMNVQIVSGVGSTDSTPTGTGNLIIGYNEKRPSGNDKTGSHMLVIGREHAYTSYGGMVVGNYNAASGAYTSVIGGRWNTASGDYASVSGGEGNTAGGSRASVSGGSYNVAGGVSSSVSGGNARSATESNDWVAGPLFEED